MASAHRHTILILFFFIALFSHANTAALAHLDDQASSSFDIEKIAFYCDIPLDAHEFFYLSGLKQNSLLTKDDIEKAVKRLTIKKRFQNVAVDVREADGRKNLHFTLTANWIFKKLEFEGIWFGKPHYATLYMQQAGEVFDAHLHEESLKAIKQYLHDQGYFKCIIRDEIQYLSRDKTITVRIKVAKKTRFTINNAAVVFADLEEQKIAQQPTENLEAMTNEIASRFRSAFTESYYSKKQIKKHVNKIRALLKDEGFVNTRISMSHTATKSALDVTLKIQLGKRKIITLTGNDIFSDHDIKEDFIGKDAPDWIFSPDIIAQQLLHEYYKKGYWHAHIKPEKIGSIGYNFLIDEGEPTTIEKIDIVDIKTHAQERSAENLNDLLKDKTCDQALLDESLERLKQFYLTHGYWDFKIIDKRFEKIPNKNTYTVKIVLDKGRQRLWGGFAIEGFKHLEQDEFFKKFRNIRAAQHIPFNQQWLLEQRSYLLHHFQKQGYWYVSVEPQLIVVPDDKKQSNAKLKVLVQWNIVPGPQVTFGKTIIRGATTVDFARLKKQCAFDEGMVWSREKIDRTRKKLKNLDVFKTVQIQPYQLSKNKSKKPILITLVDDDPVELRARVGYFINSKNILFRRQDTPKVGASFIIKNPTNRADLIALAGDWTRFERKVTCDYQQPSPWGISAMGTLKGYANEFTHPVEIQNSGSAYQALQYGFLAGLSEQYKEHYHWGINVGNEWLRITRVHGNLKFDPNLINKTLPYFFVEPNFEIDTLDDRTNTTSGSLTQMCVKMMLPETAGELTAKATIEQSLFVPLYKKIIAAGHIRVGHIFGRKFDKILPNERFYLGGPYSVRGYEPDALPPLGVTDVIRDGKTVKAFTIQGGSSMVNASIELRFPVYKSFGAVLFQDVGILSQSGIPGFKDRWYPGSGFGFRYKTPIGSLRFDIGWKWKRRLKEDTKTYAWYLTLGEAF